MMIIANRFLLVTICLVMAACSSASVVAPSDTGAPLATISTAPTGGGEFTVATWNVEHLAHPISAGCRPRTNQEIQELRRYAARIDADVVALQEVASLKALELIFPVEEWQLFISGRPDSEPYTCRGSDAESTQQKTAYAVKDHINVLRVETLAEFGLGDPGLRHGLQLTARTPLGDVRMLNVHMKSGCFVDDYSRADSQDCEVFSRQAPILDAWVEEQERLRQPYLVLGDFNHRLSAPYNRLTRLLSENADGTPSDLANRTAHLIGCHPWYPAPIDHILAGRLGGAAVVTSARVHMFEDMDPERMLSDHCAVSLTIEVGQLPLSNSVKWQTTSKEYAFLAWRTYRQATERLMNAERPDSPWVVIMDVDETVLDNGAYQVNLDRTGSTYSPGTWADWVESEQATLVPGAGAFIETVIELGGRLAFVTNRERTLDHHTWSNMKDLGLPITPMNACLMGRSAEDVSAIDNRTIVTDKDLRRRQLEMGMSSCYESEGERHTDFPDVTVVMQVGDNIEDFPGTTQEEADVEALLASTNPVYILLPNPMYGSW